MAEVSEELEFTVQDWYYDVRIVTMGKSTFGTTSNRRSTRLPIQRPRNIEIGEAGGLSGRESPNLRSGKRV